MLNFKEYLDEAVRYGEKRCTAVTCNAIAKHHDVESAKLGSDHNVGTGAGVVEHLKKHGMSIKGSGWEHEGKSVKKFASFNSSLGNLIPIAYYGSSNIPILRNPYFPCLVQTAVNTGEYAISIKMNSSRET